ncbi:MAG: cytochrome c maturation protein CcmE [Acidobacteriota bacterium]|nr:cytochrome c maturation protein CcmE [Acidobacteriota bacterium]
MTDLRAEVPGAAPPATAGAPAPGAAPVAPRRRRRLRYGVVGAVFAGAVAFLVSQVGGSLDYFETVDQAVAHRASLGAQTVRLEGLVVPGSVHRDGTGVDFVAAGVHDRVAVHDTGSPPQLFQADIPVVVVGHFTGSGFAAGQIIVDHSATYIEQHPARVRAPNGTTR